MVTRLTLQNDQWIDVKDRVRVRDKRDVHTYSVDGVSSDGQTYRFNVVKHQIATAAVRITNWSVKDEAGKAIAWPIGKAPFKERVDTIENLDEEAFDGITAALSGHIKAVDDETVTEKNVTPDGETSSGLSLPSAS